MDGSRCGGRRSGKRLQAKLSEVKAELRRRLHDPIPKVGAWLRSVILGHLQYYGVPMNWPALFTFCFQVGWLWHRALAARSARAGLLGPDAAAYRALAAPSHALLIPIPWR